jgi:uncharacterized protein YxeA
LKEEKMKKKIIIISLILLIIDISLYILGNNHYNHYKQYTENSYIEIPNIINKTEYEAEMSFGTTVSYIGVFILFVSALLIAIGFFIKEN